MTEIRFATFNIGGGVPLQKNAEFNVQRFSAVDYISGLIVDNHLDIACFQEILMKDDEYESMSKEIAHKSGLFYFEELLLSDSHTVKKRKMGIAVVSKYPIIESERFMLENPHVSEQRESGAMYKSHEKGFLAVRIKTPSYGLCVVTGHCFPFHSSDRDVMKFKYIYTKLEKKLLKLLTENQHTVVGGDFNTSRLPLLMPAVFENYNSVVNSPTRPNGRRDDYILVDREFQIVGAGIIKTCFDHYGCMGIFSII